MQGSPDPATTSSSSSSLWREVGVTLFNYVNYSFTGRSPTNLCSLNHKKTKKII